MTYKHYETLGVAKDASAEQIKSAYRKLAIKHHPDKGGDENKFKEISAAYDVVGDEQKRQEYDQLGDEGLMSGGGGGAPGFNPHDLFAHMFSQMNMGGNMGGGFHFNMQTHLNRNQPQKRADKAHDIHVSLQEAYFGMKKTLRISVEKRCMSCLATCNQCQGQGMINDIVRNGPFTQISNRTCSTCSGSGNATHPNKDCVTCNGKGLYHEEHVVEIDIPPGITTSGFKYVAPGLGEQCQSKNDIPGDLHLRFVVNPHPLFKRKQGDESSIILEGIEITFAESVIGKNIKIPHFEGEFILNTHDVFGILQPQIQYVLLGKGMPKEGTKRFGDLVLTFKVIYPTLKLSQEHIMVLQEAFKTTGLMMQDHTEHQ
jgi:DnaJ-class molecular chaperone